MIEFESLEDAKRTKEALNGADIYSGCCTLKIEYAKPTKLNVYKNDSESWDYTQPTLGRTKDGPPSRPGPLLPEPPRRLPTPSGPPSMPNYSESPLSISHPSYALIYPSPASVYTSGGGYPDDDYYGAPPAFEFERSYNSPVLDKFIGKPRGMSGPPSGPGGFGRPPLVANNPPMTPTGAGAPGGGSVLMVYELDPARCNPDKIFNLFCLYGNVAKIKFLKTKEGCCMVQMGDTLSAERAMGNLSKTLLCNGKRLAVAYSKQVFLSDVSHPYELPDGSESFKDFTGSRKNRFMNPKMAMKNRIQPPSQLLHFFNAPPDITEEQLTDIFTKADVAPPKAVNIFPIRNSEDDKPASSASGLIEFEELKDAVDAIMQCNHFPIQSDSGKYPFMLKLCFSSARNVNSSSRRYRDNFEEEAD
ncbi:heterogeneous nuclear ribonucleoprotein L isoform X4 [Diaphorina citri]|uniref:Heterogeneous nuclear ribonucleoprotein L isoform X1 n=2 Tax=Diaphorina citri TaxID=121845 RepID=A0A3Q0JCK6_DIACI|nr:heterogeneous nuclear ribonucleoprotein L isoform X1 [Diaphorina citri]XP_026684451.1 heterogeneous nuclear ribonucleoprotein L isoform X1 [Diaphorina citri]XP_026684456.1 heterogeneous nuclear ribonucleoprotein L isoform X1 [Diaphorina citri]XP_026684458.1 heterogeneous nuclear ribonucleoprotein L isoform X1 [Diaphorina citri]XP_026684460.1 heterogeneous nuclear ribonucleoprotein L isoform X1 [Diaphorina citri]XP_026684467.1 heterogeneous nuclear ribonucleoprotein L isoform X2 [Diaphorina 